MRLIHLTILFVFVLNLHAGFEMSAIFSDGMILQRSKEVCIWGKGKPRATVFVMASWTTHTKVQVDTAGNWKVMLPPARTKGVFELTILHEKDVKKINNIRFGEVWICSGQSNMEMPLSGWPPKDTIEGGAFEIKNYSNDSLRMFTLERAYSFIPETTCKGKWISAVGESKKYFSATAYFFAKRMSEELRVPIGIIQTSWGGTSAESWTNPEYLKQMPDFSDWVKLYPELAKQQLVLEKWIKNHPTTPIQNNDFKNLSFSDEGCAGSTWDDSRWPSMKLPAYWEYSGLPAFDGVVWYRKEITVPANWKGNTQLLLPAIDDMDRAYVNGIFVGATEETGKWQVPRVYTFSDGILKPGKNTIAIRVVDNQGGGGIGENRRMRIQNIVDTTLNIDLGGNWKYLPVAEFRNGIFYHYKPESLEFLSRPSSSQGNQDTPGSLFNAMIRPIVPFSCRGFVWYQGETNVGRAEQYKRLLPLLIEGWREAWKQKLPFYVVQIAPYNYNSGNTSGFLRNAQRHVAETTPNCGLIVTQDLGMPDNVHPMKKKEVGERIAWWVLNKDFQRPYVFSGPKVTAISPDNNSIKVEFDFAEGLKIINDSEFEIAGEDKKFYKAVSKIEGNTLVLKSDQVAAPKYFRYAMNDTSSATIYNGAGLPASCFTNE